MDKKTKKYNLSIKRIVSRLFLTFIVGVLFGLAMMPFLQSAENLYDVQQAAIGNQNMWRMIALWGLFTTLFSVIAFVKKRFRMTATLLIMCFFLSFLLLGAANYFRDKREYVTCHRMQPYSIEDEFGRSLNHIAQRLSITDNSNTYLSLAFQNRNCININYDEGRNVIGNAEGVFIENDPTIQNLSIMLSPDYATLDDLSLSLILIHEMSHVGQYINSINTKTEVDCFDNEAEAFMTQAIYYNSFNSEERRSIYARLRDNIELNPSIPIILLFEEHGAEVHKSCSLIKTTNLLTDEQFNQCYWDGLRNKILNDIKSSEYYIQQCSS